MIIDSLEVAEENLSGAYTWSEAIEACSKLGEGWRLPTKDELDLLYQNKDALGGFGEGWLWSSSQYVNINAWIQRFSDGYQYDTYKDYEYGVRAVRTIVEVVE